MASRKKETEAQNEPQPNLIFVGLKDGREPKTFHTDGDDKITIAPVESQVAEHVVKAATESEPAEIERVAIPFYNENAVRIVRALGVRNYKIFEPKDTRGDQGTQGGDNTDPDQTEG